MMFNQKTHELNLDDSEVASAMMKQKAIQDARSTPVRAEGSYLPDLEKYGIKVTFAGLKYKHNPLTGEFDKNGN